jgi:hypothetical protein
MNWSNKFNSKNNNNFNFSRAIYIPPSKFGTYIYTNNLNSIKIVKVTHNNNNNNKHNNKFSHSTFEFNNNNNTMKPNKKNNYLNYYDDIDYSYSHKTSYKSPATPLMFNKAINQRMTTKNANNENLKTKTTNYEPFTNLNSRKINTFNRIMYLPTPKENRELLIKKSINNEPIITNNIRIRKSFDSNSRSSSDSGNSSNLSNENNNNTSSNNNNSESSESNYNRKHSIESDVNTMNVNEEINLNNNIPSDESEYEYMKDNVKRSYVPYKENKSKHQSVTDFSTEFFFKRKDDPPEDLINSENVILKHLSELAKHRAAAFSQKSKNLFRVF